MTDETMSKETYTQTNEQYATPSSIELRILPENLLKNIEVLLSGKKLVGTRKLPDGTNALIYSTEGVPLVNEVGLRFIMGYLNNHFSPQVVQGNTTMEMWEDFTVRIEQDFNRMVMTNLKNWGIDDNYYQPITDTILNSLALFNTRTIDNKERESYGPTMKTVETIGSGPAKSTGGIFKSWVSAGR